MNTTINLVRGCRLLAVVSIVTQILSASASAAVQQSWVRHYDGGMPSKLSQPFAMQLDGSGNTYVVGSAGNTSNLLDYVTLKYASDGTLLWSKRYGSNNGLNNVPRAIGLDTNANLYVTGTSATVKYSSTGDEVWTAPYSGRALAVQGTNLYVTGFSSTNFATASLSLDGIPQWLRMRPARFPAGDYSLSVFPDKNQHVVVVGSATVVQDRTGNYTSPLLVDYDQTGTEVLVTNLSAGFLLPGQTMTPPVQGKSGRLYLIGALIPHDWSFQVLARNSDGSSVWDFFGYESARGDAILDISESHANLYAAGSLYGDINAESYFGLVQIKADGSFGWKTSLRNTGSDGQAPSTMQGLAEAVSVGVGEQPCVTGYIYDPSVISSANIATAKYDASGTLLWTQQYNGIANGNDEGKAVVSDVFGNVYVAGLSTTPEGGTEIVVIKYSEYSSIEKSLSGSMLLQFPGTPGQPYKIQASTNFPNWLDIGLGTATTNGILQFEDTNATKYPFRFYQTVTPVQGGSDTKR